MDKRSKQIASNRTIKQTNPQFSKYTSDAQVRTYVQSMPEIMSCCLRAKQGGRQASIFRASSFDLSQTGGVKGRMEAGASS